MRKFWPALLISGLMLIATAGCNLPNKQSEEESKVGVEEPVNENAVAPETEKAPEEAPAENVTGAPTETQAPSEGVETPSEETQAPAPEGTQAPAEGTQEAPAEGTQAPAQTPPGN